MKERNSEFKRHNLSYYSIFKHKIVLFLYAVMTLLFAVIFFIGILRLIFAVIMTIPELSISTDGSDYSYLPDFLGGLIGIVVGLFADSIFMSRFQHLRRYKSLLSILNNELNDVKTTIKYIWGVEEILEEEKILKVLKEAGLINENKKIKSLDDIETLNSRLLKYDNDIKKDFYDKLFASLKEIFSNTELKNKIEMKGGLQGYNHNISFYDLENYFNKEDFDGNMEMLCTAFAYCIALDTKKITKISSPILQSIVSTPEEIAIFYNLPRLSIWSEEQGNFARELQYFYHTIESFEANYKAKTPWEFLLICKDIIDRIDNFQKVTDISYYHADTCHLLNVIVDKEKIEENLKKKYNDDIKKAKYDELFMDELKKPVKKPECEGIVVDDIRKIDFAERHPIVAQLLFFFFKPNINKSYIRYKVVLGASGSAVKKRGYIITKDIVLRKKIILKFEKDKYEEDENGGYSLLKLLGDDSKIYNTQSAISMEVLQKNEVKEKQYASDFSFSCRYFTPGIVDFISNKTDTFNVESAELSLANLNKEKIEEEAKRLSAIFEDITTVPVNGHADVIKTSKTETSVDEQGKKVTTKKAITVLDEEHHKEGIYKTICDIINKSYSENKGGVILNLRGPLGSYKNRLLQLCYLKIMKEKNENSSNESYKAFYIDLSTYEDELSINNLKKDLRSMCEIIGNNPKQPPLIILDNVREFCCGINDSYVDINEFLSNKIKEYMLIIGSDTLYTLNTEQRMKLPFLRARTVFNISSMNLSREESKKFIKNCFSIMNKKCNGKEINRIREILVKKLNFYTIDAYWLINILDKTDGLNKYCDNILELYDLGLFKYTNAMGKEQYDRLAKNIYEFEYESQHFDMKRINSPEWKVVRGHKSVIDYLVARYYVLLLRETILPDNEFTIIRNLGGGLDLYLPKSVNRFIINELSRNDIKNIIYFCERYSNVIKNYIRFECQMAYLFGQKGAELQSLTFKVLNIMKETLSEDVESNAEKRQKLFAERCFAMGYGHLGDKKEFYKYLEQIIPGGGSYDELADEINRAFHLDYYGDTSIGLYLNSSFENYSDNIFKGVNTFRKLKWDIKHKLAEFSKLNAGDINILLLQIITYCCLIIVRMREDFQEAREFIEPIQKAIGTQEKKNNGWFDFKENKEIWSKVVGLLQSTSEGDRY